MRGFCEHCPERLQAVGRSFRRGSSGGIGGDAYAVTRKSSGVTMDKEFTGGEVVHSQNCLGAVHQAWEYRDGGEVDTLSAEFNAGGDGTVRLDVSSFLSARGGGLVFWVAVLRLTRGKRAAGGTMVTAVRTDARRGFAAGSGEAGVESGMDIVCALHARGRLGKVNNVSGKGSRSRRGGDTWWGDWWRANDNAFLAGGARNIRD